MRSLRAGVSNSSPNFWAGALTGFRTGATAPEGERDAPRWLAPAVKSVAASHRPPAFALRKAPRLRGRLTAREAPALRESKEAGVLRREHRPGEGSDSGAHAHSEGAGRSVPPGGVAEERRARGAPEPAHAL